MMRIALIRLLPLAAFLVLLLAGCRRGNGEPAITADTVAFVGRENLAIARQETLQVGPPISGALVADRSASVRAEVGGTVTAVSVEAGQPVSRGQLLGRIDDTGLRDAYASSRSSLATAELSLGLARRNAERAQALAQAGAIADRDREQAEFNLSGAEAQVADARAHMVAAERQLARTEIRAPFSGVVSERPVSLGDVAQVGTVLFTIVDPASLKFEGTVPADGVEGLRPGTPVVFSVSGPGGEELEGRITRINPVVDPATRQVRLTVGVPNAGGRLIVGLFAEGRVASATRLGVVVPAAAVDRRGIRPFVVRLKSGRVERVDVALGLIDEAREQMEVTTGLAGGDTLLLGGARGLAPGTPVRVGSPAELTSRQAAAVAGGE